MNNSEYVILVDERDQEIGVEEKLLAHQKGVLHRAFSILLFNDKKELLLQQRALTKYHSAGLWTNSCCSHPQPGELTSAATFRRLKEELLLTEETLPSLHYIDAFTYKVELEDGLMEHEYDHVYVGNFNELPPINPQEAIAYKWVSIAETKRMIEADPSQFSFWFKEIISHFCEEIEAYINESLQKRNI